jgi:hypothetical protein
MASFTTAAAPTDASSVERRRTCPPVVGAAVITTVVTLARPVDDDDEAATLVPVIDLRSSQGSAGAAAVADACSQLGFFKVLNHGIPGDVVEKLEASALAFFSMPMQDKLTQGSGDPPAGPAASFKLGYGHRNIGANGDAGLLEFLLLSIGSNFGGSDPPTVLRYLPMREHACMAPL